MPRECMIEEKIKDAVIKHEDFDIMEKEIDKYKATVALTLAILAMEAKEEEIARCNELQEFFSSLEKCKNKRKIGINSLVLNKISNINQNDDNITDLFALAAANQVTSIFKNVFTKAITASIRNQ